MSKLFVLRACEVVKYDDSDYGITTIGDRYEDVRFSHDRQILDTQAEVLNKGEADIEGFWSLEQSEKLDKLHPERRNNLSSMYGDGYTYSVHDISELVI